MRSVAPPHRFQKTLERYHRHDDKQHSAVEVLAGRHGSTLELSKGVRLGSFVLILYPRNRGYRRGCTHWPAQQSIGPLLRGNLEEEPRKADGGGAPFAG